MKKRKFDYQDLLTTTKNMLAAIEQQAILHPYPTIRSRAAEATPVLQGLLRALSVEEVSKKEALNLISGYQVTTRGGAAILPMLRTPITSSRLDKDSSVRSLDDAVEIANIGQEAAEWKDATLNWCVRAINHLEGRLAYVNWHGLVDMSHVGNNYKDFPEVE